MCINVVTVSLESIKVVQVPSRKAFIFNKSLVVVTLTLYSLLIFSELSSPEKNCDPVSSPAGSDDNVVDPPQYHTYCLNHLPQICLTSSPQRDSCFPHECHKATVTVYITAAFSSHSRASILALVSVFPTPPFLAGLLYCFVGRPQQHMSTCPTADMDVPGSVTLGTPCQM